MNVDSNPQAAQMADESMVRNLAAQAEAIWPEEQHIFDRHALGDAARIVDIGCGTGELAARLLERWPGASLLGIDIDPAHLARARKRCEAAADRAAFSVGDAYALAVESASVDLAVCRHLLQAVPEPARVIAEMMRVTRPGGRLHVLAEDYGLMHFAPTRTDCDRFWRDGAMTFAARLGTDLRIGRKTPALLAAAGATDITCDYVIVDTLRTPRPLFAAIWRAWRDGFSAAIAEHSELSRAEVDDHFADMIECIEDGRGYAVWHVPVISGRRP
jgi:SAM-dependent methyltransferase